MAAELAGGVWKISAHKSVRPRKHELRFKCFQPLLPVHVRLGWLIHAACGPALLAQILMEKINAMVPWSKADNQAGTGIFAGGRYR
jgi:hypothetical protein